MLKMTMKKWIKNRRLKEVSASQPFEFRVSVGDVKSGIRNKSQFCAAANGLARMCDGDGEPLFEVVNVGRKYAHVKPRGSRTIIKYLLEKLLKKQVDSWDRGGTFRSGKYFLNPIPKGEEKRVRDLERRRKIRAQTHVVKPCTLCRFSSKGIRIFRCNKHPADRKRLGERIRLT